MSGPYYSPEDFGLVMVGDVEADLGYEFDMFVVWQRESDGALFWDTDSGCSCPSPFGDVASVDDLTHITNLAEFNRKARAWVRGGYDSRHAQRDAMERLIQKVRRRWTK